MNNRIRIVLDDIETCQSKFPLWSILYVQVEDISFPDQQWFDATTSVLSLWFPRIASLLVGSTDWVQLPFMDGDYSIELKLLKPGCVFAQFVRPKHQIVWEGEADLRYFAKQLLSAEGKMRVFFADKQNNPQIEELDILAEFLRTVVRKTSV